MVRSDFSAWWMKWAAKSSRMPGCSVRMRNTSSTASSHRQHETDALQWRMSACEVFSVQITHPFVKGRSCSACAVRRQLSAPAGSNKLRCPALRGDYICVLTWIKIDSKSRNCKTDFRRQAPRKQQMLESCMWSEVRSCILHLVLLK